LANNLKLRVKREWLGEPTMKSRKKVADLGVCPTARNYLAQIRERASLEKQKRVLPWLKGHRHLTEN